MKSSRSRILLIAIAAALAIGVGGASIAMGGKKDKEPPAGGQSSPQIITTCKSNYCYVISDPFNNAPNSQFVGATVFCPTTSYRVTGGGSFSSSGDVRANVNSSIPVDSAADADTVPDNGWRVDMNNGTPVATTFRVYAICKFVTSVTA